MRASWDYCHPCRLESLAMPSEINLLEKLRCSRHLFNSIRWNRRNPCGSIWVCARVWKNFQKRSANRFLAIPNNSGLNLSAIALLRVQYFTPREWRLNQKTFHWFRDTMDTPPVHKCCKKGIVISVLEINCHDDYFQGIHLSFLFFWKSGKKPMKEW